MELPWRRAKLGNPAAGFLRTLYVPLAQTSFVDNNGVRLLLRIDAEPERIAARLTLAGVALGLAGAFGATRALSSLLFGVEPADPSVFAGVALLLVNRRTARILASGSPRHARQSRRRVANGVAASIRDCAT
jgi:hypothetical protein